MKKSVRLIVFSLAMLMACGTLFACRKKAIDSNINVPPVENESKLPNINWDEDFDIAGYSDGYTAGLYTENTGDAVSSLVFARNQAIEQNYGITVKYKEYDLTSGDDGALYAMVQKDALTGKTMFELISTNISEAARMMNGSEPMLFNLYDSKALPYLDLDNRCWNQSASEQLSVNGKLYLLTGDLNLTEKMNMGILMYNKNILAQADQDANQKLIQSVRDGEWTLEKMSKMVRDAAVVDGSQGVKQYGLSVYNNRSFYYYIAGCGVQLATKNADDIPELTLNTQKTLDVVDKLLSFCSLAKYKENDGTCYYARYSGDFETAKNVFKNNTALFYGADLKDVDQFKLQDLGFTYGYLPYPKWNSEQKTYLTSVNPYFSNILVIPLYVSNSEFASFGLQALGENSGKVNQQYVETQCMIQGTIDDEQYEMLKLAIATPIYDLGVVFNWGNVYMGIFVDSYNSTVGGKPYTAIAISGQNNFQTLWEAYKDQVEESLSNFLYNVKQ